MRLLVDLNLKLLTVATFLLQKNKDHEANSNRHTFNSVYDFIVVGSGSAGGIVAHRLAESRRWSVLLLEAGTHNSVTNDIPMEYLNMFNSEYDWNYTMIEQIGGKAYDKRQINENRGKVLGGCSSMNAMIYNRGNRKDYDNWVESYGAQGWSYDDVLPFFKKFENNTDPELAQNKYHSTSGPVQLSSWPEPDPIMILHQRALNDMGIPTTDINGQNQVGTALAQATISKNGVRQSVANTYLDPNPFPDNLHIITGAMVTKILLNGKKAKGVQFVKQGIIHSVSSTNEVIVSAGTFNTPQLLMLSGIGPKDQLEQFGIEVVADLPVGENLSNHPAMNINFLIKEHHQNLVTTGNPFMTIDNLYEFFVNNSGPLTRFHNTITYLSTESNEDPLWPNVAFEATQLKFPPSMDDWAIYKFTERKESWDKYFQKFYGKNYLFTQPILERIRSFGSVRLQSADPFHSPIIDPQFLKDPKDFDDFLMVTKFLFYFYEKSSIAPLLEPHQPIPGCELCPEKKYVHQCDQYLKCYIIQMLYSGYHAVGTCRMGDPTRADTVLDPRLRVKGIEGLRVCDGSVMPIVTNGNTNAPCMMIGEKCAHMIKQDHRLIRNHITTRS